MPSITPTLSKLLLTGTFWILSQNAFAACTDPSGSEGDIVYNQTHKVMQFCNGTDWVSMANGFSGRLSGEIQAFSLSSCPDGWSEYTAARGRFLRGIDSTGTVDPDGVRTAGDTQEDTIGPHTHSIRAIGTTGADYFAIQNGAGSGAYLQDQFMDSSNGTNIGTETRPKNVAVLYCEKD